MASREIGTRSWTLPAEGDLVAEKYRVEALVGQGGVAAVFRAVHLGLEEKVAIKVLLPMWASTAQVAERFELEGRLQSKVRGAHVVRVYDVGHLPEGAPYIVMEYLEGSDLEVFLRERGAVPAETAIAWVLQAAEAVAEAHAAGIIHRDLKPSNLFLTANPDGTACIKVLDFGISKRTNPTASGVRATLPNQVIGSPHSMAPEQILTPDAVDARADIWALGAILYELLAGRPPFDAATMPELYHAIVERDPQPLGRREASPALEAIVRRCLAKKAEGRFEDLGALATALAAAEPSAKDSAERITRILAGKSASTSSAAIADAALRPLPAPRRRRAGIAVAVGILVVAAGIGVAGRSGVADAWHGAREQALGAPQVQGSAKLLPPPSVIAASEGPTTSRPETEPAAVAGIVPPPAGATSLAVAVAKASPPVTLSASRVNAASPSRSAFPPVPHARPGRARLRPVPPQVPFDVAAPPAPEPARAPLPPSDNPYDLPDTSGLTIVE